MRTSFHSRRSRYVVATAAWDEAEAPGFYRKLKAAKGDLDFIVAARGDFLSTFTDQELRDDFGIRVLLAVEEPGQSVAYRHALREALNDGYEGVITIDSNGKDDPSAIPLFADKLAEGADLVPGTRFMAGGRAANTPISRTLAIRLVAPTILWMGCRYWYRDQTNGFKGLSRRLLEDPRVQPLRDVFVHHNLQPFLNYVAPKLGYRTVEVPVTRTYPKGKVPTKLTSWSSQARLLADYINVALGRLNPRE